MVLKRDKYYKFQVFAYIFSFVCLSLIYVYGMQAPLCIALLINTPAYLLIILSLISTGRTFIMDEEGCTVCFWKYCKKYTWKEMKTKKIESHDLPSMLRGKFTCPYTKEAIFSPYRVHKPKSIRSWLYSLLHPLSCIYVNFSLENDSYELGRYYEVDEKIFRQKMEQWGVQLEEK